METWRRILADSIVKPKDLADRLGVDAKEIEAIVGDYPMRITPTVMARSKKRETRFGNRWFRTSPKWTTSKRKTIRSRKTS